ncbi:MAG: glycerophosphodiester phosphodiesterase [Gemmatimonadota bacterium]|nr:MAG: glycerophosphodiester phosphodiesterase [Gemmatimonadota bacterium]
MIAHRGYALRYPENTLESLEAAIEAGAAYVEFDVQLTKDGVPVLMHDADLWRTARVDRSILDITLDQVKDVWVNETARFGPKFGEVHVPTLAEAIDLLKKHPRVTAFVEIKRESLKKFGTNPVVEAVMAAIGKAVSRCVPVSFDLEAIRRARELEAASVGWVLSEWTLLVREAAERFQPEYLFCNYRMIPDEDALWPGPWRWALYEVVDPELALGLAARGAQLIETMAIGEILTDLRLKPGP